MDESVFQLKISPLIKIPLEASWVVPLVLFLPQNVGFFIPWIILKFTTSRLLQGINFRGTGIDK